ncbi:hypothetical protein P879_08882 [Paragonimus westermani]|uniref:Uncharacterized protein n=1 Tax=Paragonimus westermani TaxID=34504 RepID=A0A8T0D800_9TREM|nr:hypothetical protein P879_08882 [Paragonimus westermani]
MQATRQMTTKIAAPEPPVCPTFGQYHQYEQVLQRFLTVQDQVLYLLHAAESNQLPASISVDVIIACMTSISEWELEYFQLNAKGSSLFVPVTMKASTCLDTIKNEWKHLAKIAQKVGSLAELTQKPKERAMSLFPMLSLMSNCELISVIGNWKIFCPDGETSVPRSIASTSVHPLTDSHESTNRTESAMIAGFQKRCIQRLVRRLFSIVCELKFGWNKDNFGWEVYGCVTRFGEELPFKHVLHWSYSAANWICKFHLALENSLLTATLQLLSDFRIDEATHLPELINSGKPGLCLWLAERIAGWQAIESCLTNEPVESRKRLVKLRYSNCYFEPSKNDVIIDRLCGNLLLSHRIDGLLKDPDPNCTSLTWLQIFKHQLCWPVECSRHSHHNQRPSIVVQQFNSKHTFGWCGEALTIGTTTDLIVPPLPNSQELLMLGMALAKLQVCSPRDDHESQEVKWKTCIVNDHPIAVNPGFGVLFTTVTASLHSLPDTLRRNFRSVELTVPDWGFVADHLCAAHYLPTACRAARTKQQLAKLLDFVHCGRKSSQSSELLVNTAVSWSLLKHVMRIASLIWNRRFSDIRVNRSKVGLRSADVYAEEEDSVAETSVVQGLLRAWTEVTCRTLASSTKLWSSQATPELAKMQEIFLTIKSVFPTGYKQAIVQKKHNLPIRISWRFFEQLLKEIRTRQLELIPGQIEKITELYGLLKLRRHVMIIGRIASGKTTIWQLLANTLNRLCAIQQRIPTGSEHLHIDGVDKVGSKEKYTEWLTTLPDVIRESIEQYDLSGIDESDEAVTRVQTEHSFPGALSTRNVYRKSEMTESGTDFVKWTVLDTGDQLVSLANVCLEKHVMRCLEQCDRKGVFLYHFPHDI